MRTSSPTMDETVDNRGARGRGAAGQHLDIEVLNAYVDDRLPGGDRAAAAAHLAACADCRRELAELRATVELLRGLPQYAPRRSFQLGRGVAPAEGLGWLARLLPALPALRAATVAVALLLMTVTAGDIVSNQTGDDADEPRTEQRSLAAPTAPSQESTAFAAAGTESTGATSDEVAAPPAAMIAATSAGDAAPAPADAERNAVADDAPAEPEQESAAFDEAAPPPAAGAAGADGQTAANAADADAAPEAAFAIEEDAAPAATGGGEVSAQAPAANALAESADAVAATGIGANAGAARTQSAAVVVASPTASLATPTPPPAPVAAPDAAPPAAGTGDEDEARTRPSGWRLAEVGLGLLLLWLLVSLVGLQRLKRRSEAPG